MPQVETLQKQVTDLENKLKTTSDKCLELQQSHSTLAKDNKGLQAELSAERMKSDKAYRALEEAENNAIQSQDNEGTDQAQTSLLKQINKLNSNIRQKDSDLDLQQAVADDAMQQVDVLNQELDSMRHQVQELEDTVAKSQNQDSEYQKLQIQFEALGKEKDAAWEAHASSEETVATQSQQIIARMSHLNEIEATLDAANKTIRGFEVRVQELSEKEGELLQEVKHARHESADLTAERKELLQELDSVKTELKSLTAGGSNAEKVLIENRKLLNDKREQEEILSSLQLSFDTKLSSTTDIINAVSTHVGVDAARVSVLKTTRVTAPDVDSTGDCDSPLCRYLVEIQQGTPLLTDILQGVSESNVRFGDLEVQSLTSAILGIPESLKSYQNLWRHEKGVSEDEKSRCIDLQNCIAELESKLVQRVKERDDMAQEKDKTEGALQDSNNTISSLKTQIEDLQKKLDSAVIEAEKATIENALAQEQKEQAVKSIVDLEADKTREINELQSQRAELQSKSDKLDLKAQSLSREVTTVTAALTEVEALSDSLKKSDAAQRVLQTLKEERARLQTKNEEIEALQSRGAELATHIAGLEQQIRELKIEKSKSEHTFAELLASVDELSTKHVTSVEDKLKADKAVQIARQKADDLAQEVSNFQAMQTAHGAFKEAHSNLESRMAKAQAKIRSLEGTVAHRDEQVMLKSHEIETMQGKSRLQSTLQCQNEEMATQIDNLTGQLDDKLKELVSVTTSLEKTKEKLDVIEKESAKRIIDLDLENKKLHMKMEESKQRQEYVTGSSKGKESGLFNLIDEYEQTASRAEARRREAEKEVVKLKMQVAHLEHRVQNAQHTSNPSAVGSTGAKSFQDKMAKLKSTKELTSKASSNTVRQAAFQVDKEATKRNMLTKRLYKDVDSTAIPIKTKLGVGYISQAAYLRRLTYAKTNRDGSMCPEGNDGLDVLRIEESVGKMIHPSAAEKYLEKTRRSSGLHPKRKKKFVVYTSSAQETSASLKPISDRIKTILTVKGIPYSLVDLNEQPWRREEMEALSSCNTTLPQIFIDDKCLEGGLDELQALQDDGKLLLY